MVEMINAISERLARPVSYFHVPVPKDRNDNAYFSPLADLDLAQQTHLYLGMVHTHDDTGNAARLAQASKHARIDGVAAECGLGRGDPAGFEAVLDAHSFAARIAATDPPTSL